MLPPAGWSGGRAAAACRRSRTGTATGESWGSGWGEGRGSSWQFTRSTGKACGSANASLSLGQRWDVFISSPSSLPFLFYTSYPHFLFVPSAVSPQTPTNRHPMAYWRSREEREKYAPPYAVWVCLMSIIKPSKHLLMRQVDASGALQAEDQRGLVPGP